MGRKRKTTEQFIKEAKAIHNDKYSYDRTIYVDGTTKVEIYCNTCKKYFWQNPGNHIVLKSDCPTCANISRYDKIRLSNEEFITKARAIHGDKYSYEKTNYIRSTDKVIITCKIHGDFKIEAGHLLVGHGCSYCNKGWMTKEDFIREGNKKHNNKYDYSHVEFTQMTQTKVKIICPIHGPFLQEPHQHIIAVAACPRCARKSQAKKLSFTTQEFIQKAKEIHGDKYDYSLVDYKPNSKVEIVCKIHGSFFQRVDAHLSGRGCKLCGTIQSTQSMSEDEFIHRCKLIHQDKYDYSKVKYSHSTDIIIVICKIHGEFKIEAAGHLFGKYGCTKCGRIAVGNKLRTPQDDFILKCNQVHNNQYDYSQTIYRGSDKKIKVKCKKHGFFYTRADQHQAGHKCPKCSYSIGEEKIEQYLKNKNIKYETQKTFPNCINKRPLPFDFYLPDYNLLIEFDGEQHFKPISFGSSKFDSAELNFQRTQLHDNIKTSYATDHNIKLLRISYNKLEEIEQVLTTNLI